jgi:pilus assembly protein Flp/PilA
LHRFLADESGPTAVEYAVMLAFIITACAATIGTLGGHVQVAFETANDGW